MPDTAIVDTSALLASIDRDSPFHMAAIAVFRRRDLDFVLSPLVVAETAYVVADRFGAAAEAGFVRRLRSWRIETSSAEEWPRVADLVEQYGDFPLGATDAANIVLAERFRTDLIVTLDRRHFVAVRPNHVNAFRILPE